MGGDHGPRVIIPAALAALVREPELKLILVGQRQVLDAELAKLGGAGAVRISIQHATETVGMDEPPAQALRRKKDSSMRVAINLVHNQVAQACVSAGNTGALMATARFVLKTWPGIERPAMVATLPNIHGPVHVLDLGANVDCTPEMLLQFGVMGSILVKSLENRKDDPSVALLNIGVEDIKGNDTIKRAAELLRDSNLNYCGYIEGDAIYTGDVDVIVCDGFVGNVTLKASEGVVRMISHYTRQEFGRTLLTRLAGKMAMPVMKCLHSRVDARRYNGATLVGLKGTVIKSHGSADVLAFENAIREAVAEVRNRVPERISRELEPMLTKGLKN